MPLKIAHIEPGTPFTPVNPGPCADCGSDADTLLDFSSRPVVARCVEVLGCQARQQLTERSFVPSS